MAWFKAIKIACAGLAAGAFISLAAPSFGQETGNSGEQGGFQAGETGPGTQQDADVAVAALQTQIASLTTRLEQLEKKIEGPLTVKGPFIVTNAQGKQIFNVGEEGSGSAVTIYGGGSLIELSANSAAAVRLADSDSNDALGLTTENGAHFSLRAGNQTLHAGAKDGDMTLFLSEGQTSIDLVARKGDPFMTVNDGPKSVTVGAKGKFFGVGAFNGGSAVAALGDPGDGMNAMRIYDKGGSIVLQAGFHKNGSPAFSLWDGNNALVRVEKAAGGGSGGQVQVFDEGQQVVTLGTIDNNTGLQVKKDTDVLFAGKGAEGPEFSLQQGAEKVFNVTVPGGNAELTLGKPSSASWSMSSDPADLELAGKVGEQQLLLELATTKGLLLQNGGSTQAFIGQYKDGKNGMGIYDGETPVLFAGPSANGQPGFRVREKGGKDIATLGSKDGKEGELKLFDATGELAKMGGIGGSGTLALSQGGKPTLTLGPTETKATAALRTYHGGKMVLAAGTATGGNGAVIAFDGGGVAAAGLEGDPAAGGAIYVLNKGQMVASVNSNDRPGQGLVVVRSNAGSAIAWLGNSAGKGGEVVAANPSGDAVFAGRYLAGQDGPGNVCIGTNKGTKCLGVALTGMEGFH